MEPESGADVILGFTGTRNMPTETQLNWLSRQFEGVDVLHNGACVGSDLAAHGFGLDNGVPIIVHPPIKEAYIAFKCLKPHPLVTVLARKPYLARDRDIVDAADQLIALPDGPQRPHSGTWYTIDYAVNTLVPVIICWPDGRLSEA